MFATKTRALEARARQRYSDFIVEETYEENGEEKKWGNQLPQFTVPPDSGQAGHQPAHWRH